MRALFLAGVSLWLASCAQDGTRRTRDNAARAPSESVFLNEWLGLGRARCRVERAQRLLTETREPTAGQKLLPDVHALSLTLRCESEGGRALPLEEALPPDTLLFLRDAAASPRAPSLHTKLSVREERPLVFELSEDAQPLQAQRSFDARSGAPLYGPQPAPARLSIEDPRAVREVVLRERALDSTLDVWLTHMAEALARGTTSPDVAQTPEAKSELKRAQDLYRAICERFAPARLELAQVSQETAQHTLELTLSLVSPQRGQVTSPVASFRLALSRAAQGPWNLTRVIDLTDARTALDCAEQTTELAAQARAASGLAGAERCNVLGILLPGRCATLDGELRARAFRVAQRCIPDLRDAPQAASVPPDFQITWRRGRKSSSLDHEPRYVLSIYGDGSVVFHGRNFVQSTERSDGRTLPSLVGGLAARLRAMEWFSRRGGSWNPEHCGTQDEFGDLITVHAGEQERMIVDRDGCRGPFSAQELRDLREAVERAAGTSGWTMPAKEDDAQGVSEWIVNAE